MQQSPPKSPLRQGPGDGQACHERTWKSEADYLPVGGPTSASTLVVFSSMVGGNARNWGCAMSTVLGGKEDEKPSSKGRPVRIRRLSSRDSFGCHRNRKLCEKRVWGPGRGGGWPKVRCNDKKTI